MSKITTFQIPVRTVSEGNSTEHWVKKANRHKIQKWMVVKVFRDNKFSFKLPVEITLIRVAPRFLDAKDNLPMSMKWIADALADQLIPGKAPGRADDSKEITWKYDQKKGRVRQNIVEVIIEEK